MENGTSSDMDGFSLFDGIAESLNVGFMNYINRVSGSVPQNLLRSPYGSVSNPGNTSRLTKVSNEFYPFSSSVIGSYIPLAIVSYFFCIHQGLKFGQESKELTERFIETISTSVAFVCRIQECNIDQIFDLACSYLLHGSEILVSRVQPSEVEELLEGIIHKNGKRSCDQNPRNLHTIRRIIALTVIRAFASKYLVDAVHDSDTSITCYKSTVSDQDGMKCPCFTCSQDHPFFRSGKVYYSYYLHNVSLFPLKLSVLESTREAFATYGLIQYWMECRSRIVFKPSDEISGTDINRVNHLSPEKSNVSGLQTFLFSQIETELLHTETSPEFIILVLLNLMEIGNHISLNSFHVSSTLEQKIWNVVNTNAGVSGTILNIITQIEELEIKRYTGANFHIPDCNICSVAHRDSVCKQRVQVSQLAESFSISYSSMSESDIVKRVIYYIVKRGHSNLSIYRGLIQSVIYQMYITSNESQPKDVGMKSVAVLKGLLDSPSSSRFGAPIDAQLVGGMREDSQTNVIGQKDDGHTPRYEELDDTLLPYLVLFNRLQNIIGISVDESLILLVNVFKEIFTQCVKRVPSTGFHGIPLNEHIPAFEESSCISDMNHNKKLVFNHNYYWPVTIMSDIIGVCTAHQDNKRTISVTPRGMISDLRHSEEFNGWYLRSIRSVDIKANDTQREMDNSDAQLVFLSNKMEFNMQMKTEIFWRGEDTEQSRQRTHQEATPSYSLLLPSTVTVFLDGYKRCYEQQYPHQSFYCEESSSIYSVIISRESGESNEMELSAIELAILHYLGSTKEEKQAEEIAEGILLKGDTEFIKGSLEKYLSFLEQNSILRKNGSAWVVND